MPTSTFSTALLTVSNTASLPWSTPTWQSITKIHGIPWYYDEKATDDSPAPNYSGWSVGVAKTVKVFAQNVRNLADSAQEKYTIGRHADNDSAGRMAWQNFIKESRISFSINKTIDHVLTEHDRNPYQVLQQHNTTMLPTLDDAQVSDARIYVAESLLGDDGFVNSGGRALIPIVSKFINTLLAITWNRYRKSINTESSKKTKLLIEIKDRFSKIQVEGYVPKAHEIKDVLRLIRQATTLLVKYSDQESQGILKDLTTQLEGMLAAVRKDTSCEEAQKLSKSVRDALEQLASDSEIQEITALIRASLENLQVDVTEQVQFLTGEEVDLMDWSEGVEDLANVEEPTLWTMLGLPEKKLPFFQEWTDPNSMIDPWSEAGHGWLNDPTSGRQPLIPRWHQLVGIFRVLQCAFNGKPILLMDGVGLGKTLQGIGAIACLVYYRECYEAKGDFPGYFAKRRFNSTDGKIPDFPHIIVCPVNLKDQWEREIKRFLQPASFDLFPYTGRFDTRTNWWTAFYGKSRQKQSQRLILATYTAVQDDGVRCFRPGTKQEAGRGLKIALYQRNAPQTLYGREFSFMVMDEAHTGRKYNMAHVACRELRIKSKGLIALTATPVTTKAQDLWIMGDLLGIKGFEDHQELQKMTRELNAASRKDTKQQREAGYEGNQLRGTLIGKVNPNVPASEFAPKMCHWMKVMRERFATHIIRRTIDSKDPRGQKLFGMRPYLDHSLHLRMHTWEMENLRSFAKEIVKDNPMAAAADTRKHFYIEFRRSMLHPRLNPKFADYWKKPNSLQHWQESEEKTIKLDILAQVVKHHISTNGVAPLTTSADGKTLKVNQAFEADTQPYLECDRIVVYSAFPSSNAAIIDIFDLYGISAAELNGSMSVKKRAEALNAFRTSTTTNGPRVLILSNVGLIGLNLACANIMIMVDTTWSALDDEQLRGRIFRYPQQKQVHIYRLIALGTPDIFLNNISFDKGQLHSAFIGTDPVFREMFVPQMDDDDLISVAESDLPPGTKTKGTDDTTTKGKGKAKGKGKGTGKPEAQDKGDAGTGCTKGKGKGKEKVQDEVVGDAGIDVNPTETNVLAPSKSAGPSKQKNKGKAMAKLRAIIVSDDDNDGEGFILDSESEPTGRNKPGLKKSRLRSPQAGSKRGPSLVSPPTSPSKGYKRVCEQPLTIINAPDFSANVGLIEATSHLHVADVSSPHVADVSFPHVADVVMGDAILATLKAPGGEDSPDEDDANARLALRMPPPVPIRDHDPTSSPLTSTHSHSDDIEVDDTTYSIPHRPTPGSSTRLAQVATSPPPLPLIGCLHGGSLARNRDGSGNSREKRGRGKRGKK